MIFVRFVSERSDIATVTRQTLVVTHNIYLTLPFSNVAKILGRAQTELKIFTNFE